MVWRRALAVAGISMLLTPLWAGGLQDAIAHRDILTLEAIGAASNGDQARLALGAAASLRHKDEDARAILAPLSQPETPAEIRSGACLALADIYLRQGRYADLRATLECARDSSGKALSSEQAQMLDYGRVLAGEQPMRLVQPAAGMVGARRDEAGLTRLHVEINGRRKWAVIDTDASFCVVSEATAEQLDVKVFETPVSIVTTAREDQPMHLGMAHELKIGDAILSDVVFAVLPDAAMRFGPGYRMDAVIGLPVLVALRRISVAEEGAGPAFYYGPRPDLPGAGPPNLVLSGLDPFALVRESRTGATLRLAIDSAASKTTLNGSALREFPALAENTTQSWAEWQGVGGKRTDLHVRVLPEVILGVGDRQIALQRIKAMSFEEPDRHGAIGIDLLRQGRSWTLDFDRMELRIGD